MVFPGPSRGDNERYAALSVGHPNAYAKGPLEQKLKSWYVLAFQVPGLTEWALRAGRYSAETGPHVPPTRHVERAERTVRLVAA